MFKRRNQIPKWVEHDIVSKRTREVLKRIVSSQPSLPLESPRKAFFTLVNLPQKNIQDAQYYIGQEGWKCVTNPSSEDPNYYWLEACKEDYVISPSIVDDIAFFERIAKMYGAEYDGWYVEIE